MSLRSYIPTLPCNLTAITGGIGCGKSVVSRILREKGYPVYDTDTGAKQIMDNDLSIHSRLCTDIHPEAVKGGVVNRQLISNVVFHDKRALFRLNSIVHSAVFMDLEKWCRQFDREKRIFVECAILRSSGLIDLIYNIWEVTAPIEIRIDRVINRNGITREQVIARIQAQDQEDVSFYNPRIIINDGIKPILPQVNSLLS